MFGQQAGGGALLPASMQFGFVVARLAYAAISISNAPHNASSARCSAPSAALFLPAVHTDHDLAHAANARHAPTSRPCHRNPSSSCTINRLPSSSPVPPAVDRVTPSRPPILTANCAQSLLTPLQAYVPKTEHEQRTSVPSSTCPHAQRRAVVDPSIEPRISTKGQTETGARPHGPPQAHHGTQRRSR
ncbi:hypothetical protein BD310DRAFT_100871 [Dichomitus squalens]|uniref:Uncharacterized protein n=1 Tax=Dichomitus squalens TaxID=114155 RepID=A0A4Q9PJB3_9APHY|nr:hypothetical protein BD310DRAFT_100871 [Dichomitus squalens]